MTAHELTVDHREPVVAATGAGAAALLGASLASPPGSARFYGLSLGVAGTYTAGALASGDIPLVERGAAQPEKGRIAASAALLGVLTFLVFYLIARVARHIPLLERAIASVLGFAHHGAGPLVVLSTLTNGAAEEIFFRGAVYAAAPTRPVAWSTFWYALATVATRNPALVLASIVMGTLFAAQRRATGGVLAPTVTHLVWSSLMLRFLPPLFPPPRAVPPPV